MAIKSQLPSVFSFHSANIRAVSDNSGEPWFSAKDVCSILGYRNDSDAIKKHCKQYGVAKRDLIDNMGRKQEATFVNEGNLYRLIIKSRKPEAIEFEIKLMEEILPAIRKTGGYTLPPFIQPAQQNALQQLVASKSGASGKIRAAIWSRFNNHFKLGSYKQLPAERFVEAVGYLVEMPLDKPASLPSKGKYNYPRRLLEQSGFITKDRPAGLDISMLCNTKTFISPLLHLLNELRADGHDVDAPWDEAMAMREGLIDANETLEKIALDALRTQHKPASTAL